MKHQAQGNTIIGTDLNAAVAQRRITIKTWDPGYHKCVSCSIQNIHFNRCRWVSYIRKSISSIIILPPGSQRKTQLKRLFRHSANFTCLAHLLYFSLLLASTIWEYWLCASCPWGVDKFLDPWPWPWAHATSQLGKVSRVRLLACTNRRICLVTKGARTPQQVQMEGSDPRQKQKVGAAPMTETTPVFGTTSMGGNC